MDMAGESAQGIGYVLCDEMMFTSRITYTAKSNGLVMKSARTMELLKVLIRQQPPQCVILDLANPGLVVTELLQFMRETCAPLPRVIAYGSHVDTASLSAARAAGCDAVLVRSKFVEELPRALPSWMAAHPGVEPAEPKASP
jgi:CheY-like chemotaxis protein